MAESNKFHPALSITNVKSLVPIELDNEQSLYHSWAALFTNLAKVHDLYDHLVPPTEDPAKTAYEQAKHADLTLWNRLDVAVLQWIYGTISKNLLYAILKRNDIAEAAWKRIEALFHDNKASRATLLEEDFTNADFEQFKSIDAYCNHLQSLADRLADVDAPVSNSTLVLRLTGSLPDAFSGTVDYIQNQDPLPSFDSCRSRLKLAERTIQSRLSRESGSRFNTALVAENAYSSSHRNTNNNNSGRFNRYRGHGRGGSGNQQHHSTRSSQQVASSQQHNTQHVRKNPLLSSPIYRGNKVGVGLPSMPIPNLSPAAQAESSSTTIQWAGCSWPKASSLPCFLFRELHSY